MLTGKYRQGKKGRAEDSGGRVFQPENSAQRTQILDTVIAIADEIGTSAGQVAIAWAATHGAVPIIGPRSMTQLTDNLGALSLDLSAEHTSRLDAANLLTPSAPARTVIPLGPDRGIIRVPRLDA